MLELPGGLAASLTGRLLAQEGWAVTKVVEGPGSPAPPEAGEYAAVAPALWAYLDEGKEIRALDRAGDSIDAAAAGDEPYELVICQLATGASHAPERYASVTGSRTVTVAISPFGLTGAYRTWQATEIVRAAMGGWLCALGDPGREPLRPPGHQSEVMAALCAVMSAVPAVLHARRGAPGETIDLSIRDAVVWFQMNPTTLYEYSGSLRGRPGAESDVNYPQGIMPCRDGQVGVNVMYYVEWFRFCDLLGEAAWKV
ncbi:MAG: CoA transferase, partial [Solirubrobacteraceae bacterium]